MKRIVTIAFSLIGLIILSSHELFLKTDTYFLQPGQASELYLFNGTFDVSENEISRDRIVNAKVLGPDFELQPTDGAYYDKEKATYLKLTFGNEGTYVAGISTLPRTLELNAQDFNEYLDHEGLETVIAARKSEGIYENGATEVYSKHVKAILQVGESKTENYKTILGYPIEFVPIDNPYTKKVGEKISFMLLANGEPLVNQTVHYSTSSPGQDAHANESSTATDENGIVTMVPSKAGNWYVATIHMVKSDKEMVDYESNWATLTFAVK